MKKMRNVFWGGALAAILTATQVLTPMAYAAGSGAGTETAGDEKPSITLEEGTYVPGEAIICVRESAPTDEMIVTGAYGSAFNRIFHRIPDVQSDELMDVSRAAALIEEEERTGNPDPDILDEAGEAPETTVIKLVRSDRLSTEELIDMYTDQPGVVFAEPNRIFSICDSDVYSYSDGWDSTGSDEAEITYPSLTDYQYGFLDGPGGMEVPGWNSKTLNADKDKYGRDIVVAVLDTGVDYNHPDLKDTLWDEGLDYPELKKLGGGKYGFNSAYEYYHGDNPTDIDDPMDIVGHGTHVAGIIAAEWNGSGTSGIAGGAKIMAVKHVTNDQGKCELASIMLGLNYISKAREAGVNLVAVNCSFGGAEDTQAQAYAARELGKAGTVVCCATGNSAEDVDFVNDTSAVMMSLPSVLAVNSSSSTGEASNFSNYGLRTSHLYAPGSSITSTFPLSMSKQYPDESISPPVTVSENVFLAEGFEGFEKSPFIYEANPYNGAALEMKEKRLDITGTDLSSNDDLITKETLGDVDKGNTVAFTAVSKYDLNEPPEGIKYSLILGTRSLSGRSEYFPKVYVKTVSGKWERPGLTGGMDTTLGFSTYPLDVTINGSPIKLDPLEIRVALCDIQYAQTGPGDTSAIIEKMWVTGAEMIPYGQDGGTSMACPAVTGEVAVLAKAFTDDSPEKRAARILAGVRLKDDFKDTCITGGLANMKNSLDEDMYTPVLDSIWAESDRIHVSGYFFGDAKDLSFSLEQGTFTWSREGDGKKLNNFTVTHDAEDPDRGDISFDIPDGIQGGDEVRVKIHDKSKKYHEERGSFQRIMTLKDPNGYAESLYYPVPVNIPEEFERYMYSSHVHSAQPLNGKIIYNCADYSEFIYHTFVYDPAGNKWTMPETPVTSYACNTAWNGMMLYFSNTDPKLLTYYDGNDIIKQTEMIPVYDSSIPDEDRWVLNSHMGYYDRCDVYYDGKNFLLFRTSYDIGVTAVYDVDPFTGTGRFIGKLKRIYDMGVTITHEETPDGNYIYIMGLNQSDTGAGFSMERFRVNTTGLIDTELVFDGGYPFSVDEEKGEEFYAGLKLWSGCGVKNGILLCGPYNVRDGEVPASSVGASPDSLDPTGYLPDVKHVSADNFFLSYDQLKTGFVPMPQKIAEPTVYFSVPTVLDGKIYFFGFTKDGFVMSYKNQDDTYEPYGEKILPGSNPRTDTDQSVKVKKLSFNPSKITLEMGNTPNTIPVNAVFTNPAVTTGIYFESSNPEILRVNPVEKDKGCVVWPVRPGTATVTAYCGDKTAKCTVTIEGRFLNNPDTLSLNKANLTLKEGEMDVLTLRTGNGEQPYLTGKEKVSWKSKNTKVATVKNGVVTAKNAGDAEITATWKMGKDVRYYTCKVNVTDVALPKENKKGDKDVKLSLSSNKLKANVGDGLMVTAKLKGNGSSSRKVKFISSNPDILTIGLSGADSQVSDPASSGNSAEVKMPVNPVAPGTAYVIVESGPEGAGEGQVNRVLCKITVSAPLKNISEVFDTWGYTAFTEEGDPVLGMKQGEVTTLSYYTDPEKCTDLTKVKWSAKGGTATVKNGVVTAKKVKKDKDGNYVPTVVTLKIGNYKKEFLVIVY